MYIANYASADFEALDNECKALVAEITAAISPPKESIWLPPGKEFQPGPMSLGQQKIYVVKQGRLQCLENEKVIFYLETGDLIGVGGHLLGSGVRLFSESTVIIDEYSRDAFLEDLQGSPKLVDSWTRFTASQLDLHALYLTRMVADSPVARPVVRSYQAGEVIIEEGTQAKDVFALLDGHAEVWSGGVKVGAIYMDEIFGAIAALTGTPRTATVKAATACMVQVLPRTNFLELMSVRPKTVLKMVEDMARVIISLNQKVIDLQKQVPGPKAERPKLPA